MLSTSLHRGLTVEANIGIGWLGLTWWERDRRTIVDAHNDGSGVGLGGSFGVGGWVSRNVAITLRVSRMSIAADTYRHTLWFLRPTAQIWVHRRVWLGGGVGVGLLLDDDRVFTCGEDLSDASLGPNLDLRIGYDLGSRTNNTFNFSFELNLGGDSTATTAALLFGYQHL